MFPGQIPGMQPGMQLPMGQMPVQSQQPGVQQMQPGMVPQMQMPQAGMQPGMSQAGMQPGMPQAGLPQQPGMPAMQMPQPGQPGMPQPTPGVQPGVMPAMSSMMNPLMQQQMMMQVLMQRQIAAQAAAGMVPGAAGAAVPSMSKSAGVPQIPQLTPQQTVQQAALAQPQAAVAALPPVRPGVPKNPLAGVLLPGSTLAQTSAPGETPVVGAATQRILAEKQRIELEKQEEENRKRKLASVKKCHLHTKLIPNKCRFCKRHEEELAKVNAELNTMEQNSALMKRKLEANTILDPAQEYTNAKTYNIPGILFEQMHKSAFLRELSEGDTCKTVDKWLEIAVQRIENCEVHMLGSATDASTFSVLLLKLLVLRPDSEQLVNQILFNRENVYVRIIGFLLIRLVFKPENLWRWLSPFLHDAQVFEYVRNEHITIGQFVERIYVEDKYGDGDCILPRIPHHVRMKRAPSLVRLEQQRERYRLNMKSIDLFHLGAKVEVNSNDDWMQGTICTSEEYLRKRDPRIDILDVCYNGDLEEWQIRCDMNMGKRIHVRLEDDTCEEIPLGNVILRTKEVWKAEGADEKKPLNKAAKASSKDSTNEALEDDTKRDDGKNPATIRDNAPREDTHGREGRERSRSRGRDRDRDRRGRGRDRDDKYDRRGDKYGDYDDYGDKYDEEKKKKWNLSYDKGKPITDQEISDYIEYMKRQAVAVGKSYASRPHDLKLAGTNHIGTEEMRLARDQTVYEGRGFYDQRGGLQRKDQETALMGGHAASAAAPTVPNDVIARYTATRAATAQAKSDVDGVDVLKLGKR